MSLLSAMTFNLQTVRTIAVRVGAFLAGVGVLYHEVFISTTAEPLLVFLGLWLCGIPPAMFFDGLRKLTDTAKGSLEDTVTALDDVTDKATSPEKNDA